MIFSCPRHLRHCRKTFTHTEYSSSSVSMAFARDWSPSLDRIGALLHSTSGQEYNTCEFTFNDSTSLHSRDLLLCSTECRTRRIPVCAVAINVLCAVTRPVSHRFDRFSIVTPGPRSWDDIANTLRLPPLSEEGNPLASHLGRPHSNQSLRRSMLISVALPTSSPPTMPLLPETWPIDSKLQCIARH